MNSMGNLVNVGNIGRSLSSGGGLNMPGVASRLNLTGNKINIWPEIDTSTCSLGLSNR